MASLQNDQTTDTTLLHLYDLLCLPLFIYYLFIFAFGLYFCFCFWFCLFPCLFASNPIINMFKGILSHIDHNVQNIKEWYY